jgi:hypothetical protein
MGGLIVLPDVRLDLDDPGDAAADPVLADKPGAEEPATGGQGRAGEKLPE